jgi:hypothetical protein
MGKKREKENQKNLNNIQNNTKIIPNKNLI